MHAYGMSTCELGKSRQCASSCNYGNLVNLLCCGRHVAKFYTERTFKMVYAHTQYINRTTDLKISVNLLVFFQLSNPLSEFLFFY